MTKKCSILQTIAFVLALSISAAHSQGSAPSSQWSTIGLAAQTALDRGDFRGAESLLLQLKDIAAKNNYKGQYVTRPNISLAEIYRQQGKYQQAEQLLRDTISVAEQQMGQGCEEVALIQIELATVELADGQYAKADQLLKSAQKIAENRQIASQTTLVSVLTQQARLAMNRGYFGEATACIDRLKTLVPPQKSVEYVSLCFLEGGLKQIKGDIEAAILDYSKSIALASVTMGTQHPGYGVILINAGEAYCNASNYVLAKSHLEQGDKIIRASYGSEHPEVARSEAALSELYCEIGQYSKAEELARHSLEMEQKLLGDKAIEVANGKALLAKIYRYQGKYKEAEAQAKDSVNLTRKIGGQRYFAVAAPLKSLGEICADEGKTAEGENLLKEALSIARENLGADHPDSAEVGTALAHVYSTQKRFADAEPLLKQSLDILIRRLGKQHTLVSEDFHDLADLYFQQKNFPQAESSIRESLAIDEKLFGNESARVASDLVLLGKIQQSQNKHEALKQTEDKVSKIEKTLPGSEMLSRLKPAEQILVQKGGNNSRPVADKWALVVGISNFKDPSIDLKFAAKDATDFKNFLVNTEHFKPDHVMLLTDASATREQILSKLGDDWLGTRAKKDDLVVIYISSHGSSSRQEVGVNFLLAHDSTKNSLLATGIPMQWMTKIIQEEVHADRTILILDVCHSAAAADEGKPAPKKEGEPTPSPMKNSQESKDIVYKRKENAIDPETLQLGPGQLVLCSSLADQVSWESRNYANSVFTKRLMEALQCHGEETTLREAYEQLKSLVQSEVLRDRGEMQTPLLSAKNWSGGDPKLSAQPVAPRSAAMKAE